MTIEWRDRKSAANAKHALEKLQQTLGVNEAGGITLGFGGDFDLCVAIVAWCATFRGAVPESERTEIAQKAIIDSKKAGEFTEESILKRISHGQRQYLNTRPQQYVLLSSLSVRYSRRIIRRTYPDAILRFSATKPTYLSLPGPVQFVVKHEMKQPPHFMWVRTEITARDPKSAADLAINRVDRLRATWNLYRNLRRWRTTLGGTGKCVNDVIMGPIHTLHYRDGSAATEMFWMETLPADSSAAKHLDNHTEMVAFERWVRTRLSKSPAEKSLSELLVRYVRALDENDLTSAFTKLWAVLEDLTATGRSTYDTTIRRTSFIFKDRSYHRAVLEYLRTWRNRVVHEGINAADAELFVNQLKSYVNELFLFLLNRSSKFSTLDEFGQFLDLPTDTRVLQKRVRHHELALSIFAPKLDSHEQGAATALG